MYVTTDKLADANLSQELAQVATPQRAAIIDDALMEAALRGEDLSTWPSEQVELANAAMATIQRAIVDAGGLIDGYLRVRKPTPYSVPLDPVPGIVSVWARWIARYLLHKDRVNTAEATDPVVRDYKEAMRYLELVASGRFSLGADDPQAPPSGGTPEACAPSRVFTEDSLRDFGR